MCCDFCYAEAIFAAVQITEWARTKPYVIARKTVDKSICRRRNRITQSFAKSYPVTRSFAKSHSIQLYALLHPPGPDSGDASGQPVIWPDSYVAKSYLARQLSGQRVIDVWLDSCLARRLSG